MERRERRDRLVGGQIGEIALTPNGITVAEQIVARDIVQVVEVVHTTTDTVERVIEPMQMRREFGLVAQVPFARNGGGVAHILKQAGNRCLPNG